MQVVNRRTHLDQSGVLAGFLGLLGLLVLHQRPGGRGGTLGLLHGGLALGEQVGLGRYQGDQSPDDQDQKDGEPGDVEVPLGAKRCLKGCQKIF